MNRNIPFSFWNITKLLINAALIFLTIVDLFMAIGRQNEVNIFPVDFYTPAIKIVSFVSYIV